MAELLSEIGSSKPRTKDLVGIGMTTGVNALGGLIAGRVDGYAVGKWPKSPSYPLVAVLLVALGLRYYFRGPGNTDAIARELAAGMAGWVGDDLWYAVRDFFGFGVKTFVGGQTYKMGDRVRYNDKVWQASKDIPAVPPAEPGKDARWTEVARAQGYRMEEYRLAAQAVMGDDDLWNAVADLQAEEIAPAVESFSGQKLGAEENRALVARMRDSLKRAIAAAG